LRVKQSTYLSEHHVRFLIASVASHFAASRSIQIARFRHDAAIAPPLPRDAGVIRRNPDLDARDGRSYRRYRWRSSACCARLARTPGGIGVLCVAGRLVSKQPP
jgi:hypothetical protein